MTKQESIDKALSRFDEGYACSQSVLLAFAERFDLNDKTAKLISSTFGGGMGRMREKCGAITGGFMVLGMAYGNADPTDMVTKLTAYRKVRDLNQSIEDIYGTSSCSELLRKNATETEIAERKHHKIICRKVVGDVTAMVFDSLEKDKNQ